MDSEEDFSSGFYQEDDEKDQRVKVLLFASLSLSLLLVFFGLFGREGLLEVYKKGLQLQELRGKVETLKAENEKLLFEIEGLKNDPYTIEKVAREELGMVKPGEIIFEFVESK
ncbi:MAG: septum formation initiator family protein [Candidatus Tectomicrobia bacterium]|nr:septum formation initiator family protein [Candidatus Tectomicrobia bacterium]